MCIRDSRQRVAQRQPARRRLGAQRFELGGAVDDRFGNLAGQLAAGDLQLVRNHLVETDRFGDRRGKGQELSLIHI